MKKMEKRLRRKILLASLAAAAFVSGGGYTYAAIPANVIGTVTIGGVEKTVSTPTGTFSVGEAGKALSIVNESGQGIAIYQGDAGGDVGKLEGSTISITGSTVGIRAGVKGVTTYPKLTVGGDTTEKITIAGQGSDGIQAIQGHVYLQAKEISISATGWEWATAIRAQNNSQTPQAPEGAASVTLIADTIELYGVNAGIVATSNGQVNITGNTKISSQDGIAVDVRGHSTTNINVDGKHTTVIEGDICFETPNTPGSSQGSGNLIDANVNINLSGEGSSWTGAAYQAYGDNTHGVALEDNDQYYGDVTGLTVNVQNGATWNMTDDSFVNRVTASDGGKISIQEGVETVNSGKMTASGGEIDLNGGTNLNVNQLTLDEGTLSLHGADNAVKIKTLDGNGGTVATNTLQSTVSVASKDEETAITVKGSSELTNQIASGDADLQDLANIVQSSSSESETPVSLVSQVETEANDISGGYSAKVDADGQVDAASVIIHENSTNRAVSDMAAVSLMTWRQENNDMNKRLGELRASKESQGVWMRMARGQSKYGAQQIKNQYNYYQIGYDRRCSDTSDWVIGLALSRTEGSTSFATGSGDNTHTGFAIYGSYLADNGSFLDLIAKYAHMEHTYQSIGAGVGNADYDTNGYSFSVEYGKRFTKENGFWMEPQIELTYGKVSGADYTTKNSVKVRQESMDSFVSRIGFSAGRNFKKGNAYVRASYLYDFKGDTDVTMSKDGSGSYRYEQNIGGGWWEIGVGTNLKLNESSHMYVDFEKTFGGTVVTPWQWNLGFRFGF